MKLRDLFEAKRPVNEVGRIPGLNYKEDPVSKKDDTIDRVTLTLDGKQSEIMTKLGLGYKKLDNIEKACKARRDKMNAQVKEKMGDMFDAEDVWATRVVDTKSATMTLAKQSKGTEAVPGRIEAVVNWEQVAMELMGLQEELLEKGKSLIAKYTDIVRIPGIPASPPKSPALTVKVKNESINEGFSLSAITAWAKKYLAYFQAWGVSFDKKLAKVKAEIGIAESAEHKPMIAMPTEELKQIMRDEKDKTSSRYLAAKHILLQRRVQGK